MMIFFDVEAHHLISRHVFDLFPSSHLFAFCFEKNVLRVPCNQMLFKMIISIAKVIIPNEMMLVFYRYSITGCSSPCCLLLPSCFGSTVVQNSHDDHHEN